MRLVTAAFLTCITFAGISLAEKPGDKQAKPAKAPLAPKAGIKTPGIQLPFASLTAEATIAAADKPAWTAFIADGGGAGGGGGARGGGGGGRGAGGGGGRGGGRAGGGGAPGAAAGPTAGNLYIPAADKLVKIETKGNKESGALAGLKQPCGGILSAFGSLWVPTCGDNALQRVDARSGKITATITSGAANIKGSIAASTDSIWLITDTKETVSRIDPEQNAVVGEFRVPAGCTGLTFAETSLWMACPEQNKILRINPVTNIVDKRIEVSGRPVLIATGESSIWVLCAKDGKIDRIDPKTDKVSKTIDLLTPGADGGIAFSDGFLWVTAPGFPITRIDPTAEAVAQQFWGEGGGSLTASAGALWLTNLSGPNAGTIW